MSFTLTDAGGSVVLPDPEYPDGESFNFHGVVHEAEADFLLSRIPTNRDPETVYTFKFDSLVSAIFLSLHTFVADNVGQPCTVSWALSRHGETYDIFSSRSMMIVSDESEFIIERFDCDVVISLDLLDLGA